MMYPSQQCNHGVYMSYENKKIQEPNHTYGDRLETKRAIEKNRAKKEEVMEATKRGIDKYRTALKNLAKR